MKGRKIKISWPNNNETYASEGDDWFLIAKKAGVEIPTGCLTGSCGACEIDVNGETVRPCISNLECKNNCPLKVNLTSDPFGKHKFMSRLLVISLIKTIKNFFL